MNNLSNKMKDAVSNIKDCKDTLAHLIAKKVEEILKENEGAISVVVYDYTLGQDNNNDGIVVWFDTWLFMDICDLEPDELVTIAERLDYNNYTIIKNTNIV